jgi:hypothetical protein
MPNVLICKMYYHNIKANFLHLGVYPHLIYEALIPTHVLVFILALKAIILYVPTHNVAHSCSVQCHHLCGLQYSMHR